MKNTLPVSVVIPYYQKSPGLLTKALTSIYKQTYNGDISIIIVDDSSPYPASKELQEFTLLEDSIDIILLKQENGGAGSARNTALEAITERTEFVAFLDSDDSWQPHHLESAISAIEKGYDAYFSDWWSFNYPDTTNFERIKALKPEKHKKISDIDDVYELGVTPIDHILIDGGGVIQTSTVVYKYSKFSNLRFREEFFNGQDFFFWMDLGELGAKFIFSTQVGCKNGEGINIYQGSGWGTERSLQRIRNELFVWTSAEKFYPLSENLHKANQSTIRNLQEAVVRDLIHRILHWKPISLKLLQDIFKMSPSTIFYFFLMPVKITWQKLLNTIHRQDFI